MINRFNDDVYKRSELECAIARADRLFREATADVSFQATWVYLLKSATGKCLKKWRGAVRRMQAAGDSNRQIADALVRLSVAT